jgi:hypothetical protein
MKLAHLCILFGASVLSGAVYGQAEPSIFSPVSNQQRSSRIQPNLKLIPTMQDSLSSIRDNENFPTIKDSHRKLIEIKIIAKKQALVASETGEGILGLIKF